MKIADILNPSAAAAAAAAAAGREVAPTGSKQTSITHPHSTMFSMTDIHHPLLLSVPPAYHYYRHHPMHYYHHQHQEYLIPGNYGKPRNRFSEYEDAVICHGVERGLTWGQISAQLPNRKRATCFNRYRTLQGIRKSRRSHQDRMLSGSPYPVTRRASTVSSCSSFGSTPSPLTMPSSWLLPPNTPPSFEDETVAATTTHSSPGISRTTPAGYLFNDLQHRSGCNYWMGSAADSRYHLG